MAIGLAALVWASSAGSVGVVAATASPAAAAVPTGPFTVNMANREDVRQFYNVAHEGANAVPVGWTGSIAGCNPGTVSPDFLAATLARINYFRTMAGEPNVTFTDANNTEAQAAALLQAANNPNGGPFFINHHPPTTSNCWTQLGSDGSGASSLSIGNTGPQAIDSLMKDSGTGTPTCDGATNPGCQALGHRRNMLDPSILQMGSGSVPETAGFRATEAQLVLTTPTVPRPPVRDNFVAWPPKGFVPYQVVYPRWSFGLPTADFTAATVTMLRNGVAIPTQIKCVDPTQAATCGRFGEPAISWIPNNVPDSDSTPAWPKPTADETYSVNIGNVLVNGVAQTFAYNVTVFDPAASDPAHTPQIPQGPVALPPNQNTTFGITPVPDAAGYQWRTTALTPGDLVDGAENGLVTFTANVGAYNPVATDVKATGDAGFRLTQSTSGNGSPQTLTLKSTLLANANSKLTFDSRVENIDNLAARVEVSTDGGTTWAPAYQQISTGREGVFTPKVVSLGSFAGKQIQLRFSLTTLGTGNWFTCCDPLGWYFDNVTIANVQNVATPVLSPVGTNPSFVFNPSRQSQFLLEVRPQFVNPSFGPGFGDWSPPLQVSSVVPAITVQPVGQTVVAGSTAALTVAATGTPPLSFAWSLNGTKLVDGTSVQGSATATLTLTNVQAAQAGTYTVQVTNGAGAVTSVPAVLVVNPPPNTTGLTAALDAPGFTWSNFGDANWFAQTAITHDGVSAAQSGPIGAGQSSSLLTTINGPANVTFWWRLNPADTTLFSDSLSVAVDGVVENEISGFTDWVQSAVAIPAGTHSFGFTYFGGIGPLAGAGAGWVDQVVVAPQ